jgi:2-methylcitrate dehydratase PrpD
MTTAALVSAVRTLRYDGIPDDARLVAAQCLLDFCGCAVAGAHDPLVDILVGEVASREHATEASLVGRKERATAVTAALVNGAAGHALDYDDTHTTMMGHPSVPVIPTALALAEATGAGGRRLVEAIVAGFELECRLGGLLGAGHYLAGFHATATVGTFGAAAAAAHLLGLDADQWLCALGLAGTQAAGLKASFGTMAKPLHAGRAAATGLQAALLARRGFTAATAVVECPQGFAATHAAGPASDVWLEQSRGRFFICDTLFKHHAACYLTHAAIEATTALRQRHQLVPDAVREIEVHVAPTVLGTCNISEPNTGLELKFSLRATTALALTGEDTAAPETYSDAKAADPRLIAVRNRVRVVEDSELVPTRARVVVHANGGRFEGEADTGVPSRDLEAQQILLERKFRALASPALGASRTEEAIVAVASVADAPNAAALLAALRTD